MLLRHGLKLPDAASAVDDAVAAGSTPVRARAISPAGESWIGTAEMGARVAEFILAEALEGLS